MPHGQDHSQQLPSGHAVIALRPTESAAEVGDGTFPLPHPLGEDRTDPHVTGIGVEDERATSVGVRQDRGLGEHRLESGKGRGAGIVPDVRPACLG